MFFRDITFNEAAKQQGATEADAALQMDQETFRSFYERTARSLWVFLWRRTGDAQVADDLLQETFYRFLRARGNYESEAHRRNYVFRIAANLANDTYRQRMERPSVSLDEQRELASKEPDVIAINERRRDLNRAMAKLPARQRDALWLAYVEGSSHEEIAGILGMKVGSIKLLLFRARRKMVKLLRLKS